MANRKGQQQPMRKGTGRQPGAPLSAALAGRAAPGLASAVKQGQVASGAKLADALGASGGAMSPGKAATGSLASATSKMTESKTTAKKAPSTANRDYTTTGQLNENKGNVREGMSFATFEKADRPGIVYHEYTDPKSGERHVFGVKKNAGSIG